MDETANISPLKRPVLVLVSGGIGSGKTTLSKLLSDEIGLFRVSRDELKHGIEFTEKSLPKDRPKVVVPRYFDVLESLIGLRVSVIGDAAMFGGGIIAGRFEGLRRQNAIVINIHCHVDVDVAISRVENRQSKPIEQRKRKSHGYQINKEKIFDDTRDRLDLQIPFLEVDTSDGYSPALQEIIDFINSHAK